MSEVRTGDTQGSHVKRKGAEAIPRPSLRLTQDTPSSHRQQSLFLGTAQLKKGVVWGWTISLMTRQGLWNWKRKAILLVVCLFKAGVSFWTLQSPGRNVSFLINMENICMLNICTKVPKYVGEQDTWEVRWAQAKLLCSASHLSSWGHSVVVVFVVIDSLH